MHKIKHNQHRLGDNYDNGAEEKQAVKLLTGEDFDQVILQPAPGLSKGIVD